jgi:hypothetical protein
MCLSEVKQVPKTKTAASLATVDHTCTLQACGTADRAGARMHTASFTLHAQGVEEGYASIPAAVHGRSRGLVHSGCLQSNTAAHVVSVPHRLHHYSNMYGKLRVCDTHKDATKSPTYHGCVL